jgi:hypothetical protein
LKIDRTAPSMSIGGALARMKGKELSEDAYKLTIDALDDNEDHAIVRAGIKSIEVKLDGARASYAEQPEQACPGAGCAMHRDWEFKPFEQDLLVGEHTLQVVVTDYAGNENVQPAWKVRIARGAMTSPREGDISEKRFNLRAVAKRPGFSTATFVYRRSSTQPWTTIPAAQMKTAAGASVAGTSQPLTGGATPDARLGRRHDTARGRYAGADPRAVRRRADHAEHHGDRVLQAQRAGRGLRAGDHRPGQCRSADR